MRAAEQTRRCVRCGYDLRGLAGAENCPECGAIRADAQRSRDLSLANRCWLACIGGGAALYGVAVLAFATVLIGDYCMGISLGITDSAALTAVVAGALMMTWREPQGPYYDDPRVLRWMIRIFAIILLLAVSGSWMMQEVLSRLGPQIIVVRYAVLLIMAGPIGLILSSPFIIWYLSLLVRRSGCVGECEGRSGRLAALSIPLIAAALAILVATSLLGFTNAAMRWLLLGGYVLILLVPAVYALAWAARVYRIIKYAKGA